MILCTVLILYYIFFSFQISAKLGTGVSSLLKAVINDIPPPTGQRGGPLRLLLFDSWYERYRGVVCLVNVRDGIVRRGKWAWLITTHDHVTR